MAVETESRALNIDLSEITPQTPKTDVLSRVMYMLEQCGVVIDAVQKKGEARLIVSEPFDYKPLTELFEPAIDCLTNIPRKPSVLVVAPGELVPTPGSDHLQRVLYGDNLGSIIEGTDEEVKPIIAEDWTIIASI